VSAGKGGGDRWDVKGLDVPGRRFNRSVMKGLGHLDDAAQAKHKKARHAALDRFRAIARDMEEQDKQAVWSLIPRIGLKGYPTWDEVVAARNKTEILALATRGELHAETDARKDRGAQSSERRTCVQGVDEYLRWQEKKDFAPDTTATASSLLRRVLEIEGRDGVRIADCRVGSLIRSDSDWILDALSISDRTGEPVSSETRGKQRKILKAWMQYELHKEQDRAEEQNRQPLFSVNVFSEKTARYSKPIKDAAQTLDDVETRRFFPDQMRSLLDGARGLWFYLILVTRRLGLRPGEAVHIRWMDDVVPLPDGNGYEIRLEGGRRRDPRCGCRQCQSKKGWSPKNGPRRYVLDRRYDELGWIREVCDALDAWVKIRRPERSDFMFPDPDDWATAMSNGKLNGGLHDVAARAGVVTGLGEQGSRTFHSLRHTCACELLEAGVTHPHAAYWIGDTLREFLATYGRPTDEAMAKAIFSSRV
jgi:hypothetical protein